MINVLRKYDEFMDLNDEFMNIFNRDRKRIRQGMNTGAENDVVFFVYLARRHVADYYCTVRCLCVLFSAILNR